jgi:glycosyltransferase involved in cell wall biosynthesis
MTIAIVTCYDQNDYVRARALRTAFAAVPGVKTIVVRNSHTNWRRYPEVMGRLLKLRFSEKPDAYVVTFRGYEMLLFMWLTFWRKPIIFDELINMTEWLEEHGKIKPGTPAYGFCRWFYSRLCHKTRLVLADTQAHAEHSAKLTRLPLDHYFAVPVGVDETVFHPVKRAPHDTKSFEVFFYGTMMPLHGLDVMLQTALLLKNQNDIVFHFVGGKQKTADTIQMAVKSGARITYDKWLPFEDLAKATAHANLTLGGPFGDTLQSRFVVTGKAFQFLAQGAPVVIGRNEVSNVFTDKVDCLMVPQGNARALADAIVWARQHPTELAHIAANGRKLYEQQFSQQHVNALVARIVEDHLR